MRRDAVEKREQFIDCSVKIHETFSFVQPNEQLQAVEKYCTSVYGSNLYDFNRKEFSLEDLREAGLGRPLQLSDVSPAASVGPRGPISSCEPTNEVQELLQKPAGEPKS